MDGDTWIDGYSDTGILTKIQTYEYKLTEEWGMGGNRHKGNQG